MLIKIFRKKKVIALFSERVRATKECTNIHSAFLSQDTRQLRLNQLLIFSCILSSFWTWTSKYGNQTTRSRGSVVKRDVLPTGRQGVRVQLNAKVIGEEEPLHKLHSSKDRGIFLLCLAPKLEYEYGTEKTKQHNEILKNVWQKLVFKSLYLKSRAITPSWRFALLIIM